MDTKRICIYPKDIMIITGKSSSSSRRILSEIKKYYSKKPSQLVTVHEFCCYYGINDEEVKKYLG